MAQSGVHRHGRRTSPINVKPSPPAALALAMARDSVIPAARQGNHWGGNRVSAEGQPVLIEIAGLTKRFGSFTAVDNVSFNVARGEVLGFLGPNGAGKSTTMRMLAGFMTPTSGSASICGHDGGERADRVDHAIGLTSLAGVRLQPVETLSKGFKRRVGLAQALLHDPPVLVLDEPTDGLDPNQKREVRALITQMRPEKAIIISTHLLDEVEAVCSRAIVIAAGKVVVDATPAELCEMHPSGKLDDVFRQLTLEAAA